MAEIKLTIPDAIMPDVIEALADRGGYNTQMPRGEGEPQQTKQQAARAHLIDYIKTVTRHYKAEAKAVEARNAALAEADEALDIT